MIRKAKHSYFRRYRLFLSVLFIFISYAAGSLYAQENDPKAHLLRSIEQTRKQIQAERGRIEREQLAQEKELEQARTRQESLVDEIVELKFEVAEKQARLKSKRLEEKKLKHQYSLSRNKWSEVRIIAEDAYNKISDSLDLMPVSESREKQIQLLAKIRSELENTQQTHIDINPLLELIGSLLRESSTAAVYSDTIRGAQGYKKQVELFRLGQILYAYKTPSGQTAVAVSGSADAAGFRWNENIPRWASQDISRVIDGQAANSGPYMVPADVSQQMVSQQDTNSGLQGKLTAGGPVMIPLAIIALLAVVLIIERSVFFLRQGRNTTAAAENILAACHTGDFQKAEQIAVKNPNVISKTMLSCLSMRRESTADMEDAIAESILHELPALERFLSSIGILAGVAPLLGLLGTVTGMISTFDSITVFGSGQPKQLMAGGISEALITTATGLIIAIPILLVHSYLTSRSENLIADTERYSATLLNLLKSQSEQSTPGAEEKQHE